MLIREITIKNFRSIVNQTISAKSMNIFVGMNDAGKSNILKALNLFFNGETDINSKFNFDTDYSKLAPYRANKAKEITVQIKLTIPDNYKDAGDVVWTKVWRQDGLISNKKNKEFSAYAKADNLLNRIIYKYVPAIKSDDYFKTLLGSLYSSISSDNEIIQQTSDYSEALKSFTTRISDIVKINIGIDSMLVMPENQINIFKQMSFMTTDANSFEVLLSHRGDGIKARHIPAILKFISEQDNKAITKGAVPYTTIWGYEEPENGIEISRCFDLSKEFQGYSDGIQMFITTHSPAFYSLDNTNKSKLAYVFKDENNNATIIDAKPNLQNIHEHIGLLPLVTPFISKLECELKKANTIFKDNFLTDIPTVFVEGRTDKRLLEIAIQIHSGKLYTLLENNKLRIFTKEEACGTTELCNLVRAWNYVGFKSKLYVLFDKDKAGKKAKEEIELDFESEIKKFKSQYLEPSDEIISVMAITKNKCNMIFEVEHLLSIDFWEQLISKGYTTERDCDELLYMFNSCMTKEKTVTNVIEELISDKRIRDTIIKLNPHKDKKTDIADLAEKLYKQDKEENMSIFSGFSRTVKKLEEYF